MRIRAILISGLVGGTLAWAAAATAQTITLDPLSPTLGGLSASSADLLVPVPAPPLVAGQVIGMSAAQLLLLPGDVINGITDGNDANPLSAGALQFSVARPSFAAAGAATPDVFSEATGVAPGIQPEAAGDVFVTFDFVCPATAFPGGAHTQMLDGDGVGLASPLTCYNGFGLGLLEAQALPGPPLNDNLTDFDWGLPGSSAWTRLHRVFDIYTTCEEALSSLKDVTP
jgi:hypothetical protein